VQDERPVAAETSRYHLAALGMLTDIARQRKQSQRLLVVDGVGRPALGQAGALGVLAIATLEIGPEAAGTQGDLLAGVGILAQFPGTFGFTFGALRAELARKVALGVVGAANETAAFPEPQR